MPKSGLSILLALGKRKQSEGDAPEGDAPLENEAAEPAPDNEMAEGEAEPQGQVITLPQGFKLPEGAKEGEPFTTTIRGTVTNGQLAVEAIGDMPLHAETGETPEAEAMESPEEEAAEPTEEDQAYQAQLQDYQKKKADDAAANKVFRGQ